MVQKPVDITLEVISPEKTIVSQMVSSVELPGEVGRFEVLRNHAPLISSLVQGEIVYTVGEKVNRLAISSGFVEICDNFVSVCVEL